MNRPCSSHLPLAISALLTGASLAKADIITVCLDGSCDFTTIEAAVQASRDGDTIMVGPGTYYPSEVIVIESDNFSAFTLSIIGATDSNGDPATIIDGVGRHQIMRIALFYSADSPGGIRNCVFTNGAAQAGGAVYIETETAAVFANCRFALNSAEQGGAVFAQGYPLFDNCHFIGNTAVDGAALSASGVIPFARNSSFIGNIATGRGGAVFADGSETGLYRCELSGNRAEQGGGVFSTNGNRLWISESTISDNLASQGGGVAAHGCCCTLQDSTVRGNAAKVRGGGLIIDTPGYDSFLTNSLVTSNSAAIEGGGLVSLSTFIQVAATRFCGNSAPKNRQLQGAWFDYYANCVSDVCEDCPIPGDVDLSDSVDGADLAILLSAWGTDGTGRYQTDIVADGVVNGNDLGVVLSNWGVTR